MYPLLTFESPWSVFGYHRWDDGTESQRANIDDRRSRETFLVSKVNGKPPRGRGTVARSYYPMGRGMEKWILIYKMRGVERIVLDSISVVFAPALITRQFQNIVTLQSTCNQR